MLLAIRSLDVYDQRMSMTDLDNAIRILEGVVILIAIVEGGLGLAERVQKRRRR